MIRTRSLVALVLLAACSSSGSEGAGPSTTTTIGPAASTTTAPPAGTVDWSDPALSADLGDGWLARRCEGDAPLLCIERDLDLLGVVELHDFPAGDGQPVADRIAGLYTSSAADRAQGCPPGYAVETDPPQPARAGEHDALRYGLAGRMADGRPSERTVAWMFERPGVVTVVQAAAYEADGCLPPEGSAFTVAALEEFVPALERLVTGSVFPAPRTF